MEGHHVNDGKDNDDGQWRIRNVVEQWSQKLQSY